LTKIFSKTTFDYSKESFFDSLWLLAFKLFKLKCPADSSSYGFERNERPEQSLEIKKTIS
jgi:hypothetical protein